MWVFQALQDIRNRLSFHFTGIDSEKDSEFINAAALKKTLTKLQQNQIKMVSLKETPQKQHRNDRFYVGQQAR